MVSYYGTLLQSVPNPSPNHARQRNRDIIRDGLSENCAIQTENRIQQIQQGNEQQTLPQHGQHGSRKGASDRLHTVHIDEQKTDERAGQHVGDQHLHAVCNNAAVVHEQADDRLAQEEIERGCRQSDNKAAQLGKTLGIGKTLDIARTVAVTENRLYTVCKAHLQEGDEHIRFEHDADRRNGARCRRRPESG